MPIAILALSAATPHIAFSYTLGETLMNVLIALMVHRVVLFPELSAGRLLNARLVAGFGAVSYSLYLWQQPFLNRHSAALIAAFPMNIALAIAAALLSYHLVERPALALGRRPGNGDGGATLSATSMRLQAHAAIS
jgi:peptidoglycan/LPS O-acetylase OafA/YrhL